jgi:hypothetical protein
MKVVTPTSRTLIYNQCCAVYETLKLGQFDMIPSHGHLTRNSISIYNNSIGSYIRPHFYYSSPFLPFNYVRPNQIVDKSGKEKKKCSGSKNSVSKSINLIYSIYIYRRVERVVGGKWVEFEKSLFEIYSSER